MKKCFTILIVTHNMEQAAQVFDLIPLIHLGKHFEYNDTSTMFTNLAKKPTEE